MSKYAPRRPEYAVRQPDRRRPRIVSPLPVLVAAMATTLSMVLTGCANKTEPTPTPSPPTVTPPPGSAPAAPTRVCDTPALAGQTSAPSGAIVVQSTQKLDDLVQSHSGGTTFWLEPGVHLLAEAASTTRWARSGGTPSSAPRAPCWTAAREPLRLRGVRRGRHHLLPDHPELRRIRDNNNEGVVNHDAATDWTSRQHDPATPAPGVMVGDSASATASATTASTASTPTTTRVNGIILQGNEIAGNNTDDWERPQPGCGCTGGGKFWETTGAVYPNNWVHDNHGPGLWADTNNIGFLFEGNYIRGNTAEGIVYETSYNAVIRDNTFARNGSSRDLKPGLPDGRDLHLRIRQRRAGGGLYGDLPDRRQPLRWTTGPASSRGRTPTVSPARGQHQHRRHHAGQPGGGHRRELRQPPR